MIEGGLEIDEVLDGVWAVEVVAVFEVSKVSVECLEVKENREWSVERLESEKESRTF